jgi:phage shock protein PspC (stress-responsive transcriptional regulator)
MHPPPARMSVPAGRRTRVDRCDAAAITASSPACAALSPGTDVDPVVYRVTLAVLSIFGGVGLLLYVIGWLLIPAEGAAGSVLDRVVHRRTGSRPSVPALVGIGLAVVILAGIVSNNGSAVLALVLTLLAHRALRPLVASPSDGDWDPSNQTAAGGTSPTAGSSERYAAGGAYAPYGGSACAPYGGSASAPYGGVPVASPWPDWPGGTAVESRPRPPRSVLGLVTVSVCLLVVGALLVVANLTALQSRPRRCWPASW